MPLLRWLTFGLIALAAVWLRTHDLDRRPMHADEANQAVKVGELLESGRYAFNPRDHHGPTLYYAAVPIAWARGEHSLAQLTETTVRLVPAIFGTISIVLLALIGTASSTNSTKQTAPTWPALAAAAFLAVSPPAVYYSRYFIQETLLVTFTLAAVFCAGNWWRRGGMRWAVAAGVCVGLMQATKGNAPLFLVAALIAFAAVRPRHPASAARPREFATAFLAALFTAMVLFSSFGTHLVGLRDALAVYAEAARRFDSGPTGHEKPWWYYLRIFGWHREGGLLWQQLAFSALAVAGAIAAWFTRDRFQRGAAIYTGVIVAALSLFAYKTPWHTVHFVPGLALLASGTLAAIARLRTGKFVAAAGAVFVVALLLKQTQLAAFVRPADQRNPYAYVHSVPDVLKFRALAEAALARSPGQPVRVISEEYWPLPWYFRGLDPVGYWSTPPDDCDGALVITSTTLAEAVRTRLHHTYRESYLGLRPGFICIVFTPEP